MRLFVVFFITILLSPFFSRAQSETQNIIEGTIRDVNSHKALQNVTILNLNSVKGSSTDAEGYFKISANVNDTLHISLVGYQSLKLRVTNDWIRMKTTDIKLIEKSIALEELIIHQYRLTGYLQVDAKLIPVAGDNYRNAIAGLQYSYEPSFKGGNSGINKIMNSLFNPADLLYNFFGNKPRELKKLRDMKKDDTVRNMLETKFDRETISLVLGVDKNEIPEILQRCNYSETFIKTANDLQILDAISDCYEEYRILKKKS